MEELLKFMKKNETYYLATVDEEGNPQVRPFGTFSLIDGKFYIQTGRTKNVAKEIAAHPRLAICDFATDGSQWVRIEADGVDTNDPVIEQKILDEYPNLLVVQTMSKSRALAGMRVGFAFGSENLIQGLNCVKNSINS